MKREMRTSMRKNFLEIAVVAILLIAAVITGILCFCRAICDRLDVVGGVSGEAQKVRSQERCGNKGACATESNSAVGSSSEMERESGHALKRFNRFEGSVAEDDIPVPPDGGDMPSVIPSGR